MFIVEHLNIGVVILALVEISNVKYMRILRFETHMHTIAHYPNYPCFLFCELCANLCTCVG